MKDMTYMKDPLKDGLDTVLGSKSLVASIVFEATAATEMLQLFRVKGLRTGGAFIL